MPKKGGSLRICGDFKVSKNQDFLDNRYPLPDTEEVFATLGSGTTINQILLGMEKVRCCIDAILIRTDSHIHFQVLHEVLKSLERHGIVARWSKCEFMVPSVEFLGYWVDGKGRHPTEEKIAAIKGASSPNNLVELRSYLGLLNYYGNFILSLYTVLTIT